MTERDDYYSGFKKILAAKVPLAGIDGPIHRIELTPGEYKQLDAILWDDRAGESLTREIADAMTALETSVEDNARLTRENEALRALISMFDPDLVEKFRDLIEQTAVPEQSAKEEG